MAEDWMNYVLLVVCLHSLINNAWISHTEYQNMLVGLKHNLVANCRHYKVSNTSYTMPRLARPTLNGNQVYMLMEFMEFSSS